MKKKILITGGVGMIGRRLAKILKDRNYNILILDNLASKLRPPKKIRFLKSSIVDEKKLENIFKTFQPNIVFHLAAIHHIPTCEFKRGYSQKVNIIGTENILKFADKYRTSKVILASSGAVYDWSLKFLLEDKSKIKPRDNYALCKFSNELQLKFWSERTKKKGIVARIYNTIGYDDPNSHLLPDILKQINFKKKINEITLGNLVPRRDYIDAEDVALALYKMIKYTKKDFDIFNVCCGKEYSVKQIVNILEKILKIKINVKSVNSKKRKVDRISQLGNNKKILRMLKWKPRLNLEQTLKKYIIEQKFKKINI